MTEDNRRIAEWCGIEVVCMQTPRKVEYHRMYDDSGNIVPLPDFTKIEAHEEYTWPRLRELGMAMIRFRHYDKMVHCDMFQDDIGSTWLSSARGESEADACNKAILKLMEAK